MVEVGYLKFGEETHLLKQAELSSWLSEGAFMNWLIELHPADGKNHMLLKNMMLGRARFPEELTGTNLELDAVTNDLSEQTVVVNGRARMMGYLELKVGEWNGSEQRLTIKGKGLVEGDTPDDYLPYEFQAECLWHGMSVHNQSREAVMIDIMNFWGLKEDQLAIECRQGIHGFSCDVKKQCETKSV